MLAQEAFSCIWAIVVQIERRWERLPETLTVLAWASLLTNLILGTLTIIFGLLFVQERREARGSRKELSSFLKAYTNLGQVVQLDGKKGRIVRSAHGEYANEWTVKYGADVVLTKDSVETRKISRNEEE